MRGHKQSIEFPQTNAEVGRAREETVRVRRVEEEAVDVRLVMLDLQDAGHPIGAE